MDFLMSAFAPPRETIEETLLFAVTFPVAEKEVVPHVVASTDAPPPRSTGIIVAEEIEINREIIRGILASAGDRVQIALNRRDAVLAASTKNYDIVLIGIRMPGIDGVGETTRIRALSQPAGWLPIIANDRRNPGLESRPIQGRQDG